jgi:hypothetical protein
MPSNTFISHQYYARAWNNAAETKLVEGQFVFVHRDYAPVRVGTSTLEVNTFTNPAHMNMIMRQAWNSYVAALTDPASPASRLRGLLRLHGEHEVQGYECAARLSRSVEANLGDQSVVSDTLQELCKFSRDRKLRYVISPIYILDNWNFAGVVRTGADTTTGGSIQRLKETDRIVSLTLTVARRAEIHDIFPGGCEDGALCWFILKRILDGKTGQYGPFQFVPYASAVYDAPPLNELMYRDLAGNIAYGVPIYIGRITLVNKSETPRTIRGNADIASGMRFTTDLEQQRRATAALSIVTIQLHD